MATTTTRLPERSEVLAETGLTPLLTTQQVAAYYGVDRATVNRWVQRGLPTAAVRIAGRRFKFAAVEAWMNAEPAAA